MKKTAFTLIELIMVIGFASFAVAGAAVAGAAVVVALLFFIP